VTDRIERVVHGITRDVARMGDLVRVQLEGALAALVRRDPILAEEVLRGDDEVDALDIRIEEAGLAALADNVLGAEALRAVVASVRIVTQLERIGDLAANVAERAATLAPKPPLSPLADLGRMGSRVQDMVETALLAFTTRDAELARRVLAMDETVDEIHRAAFEVLENVMREKPETIGCAVEMLSCSRHLERIGDHAKNVAEDVVYLCEGRIVRHPRVQAARDAILVAP
jgi:phosphate transport system protein